MVLCIPSRSQAYGLMCYPLGAIDGAVGGICVLPRRIAVDMNDEDDTSPDLENCLTFCRGCVLIGQIVKDKL